MTSGRLILTLAAAITLIASGDARAELSLNPFKKKKPLTTVVPSGSDMRAAEATAGALYTKATDAEATGSSSQAMATYRQILTNYPFTSVAPAAQFRIAAGLEKEAKYEKAFDTYQELLTNYRQTPQFAEAVDRQFGIARLSRTEKTSAIFGIKKRMDYDQILEMLNTVIANAPQGPHAAEAQFEIGLVHEEDNNQDAAIAAYRKVVDDFPQSTFAAEAQTKVGKGYIDKVEDGNRDMSNINKAREATQEAGSLFDTSDLSGTRGQIDEAAAEASYTTGQFYDRKGNLRAAMIYYNEVLQAPGSEHYEKVRDRVATITASNPELAKTVKAMPLDNLNLAVQAPTDLKGRADYFGPPAPASKTAAGVRKPRMRPGEQIPITPLEPELPTSGALGPDPTLLDPTAPGSAPPPLPDFTPPSLPDQPPALEPVPSLEPAPVPQAPTLPEPAPAEPPPAPPGESVPSTAPAPLPEPMPAAPTAN